MIPQGKKKIFVILDTSPHDVKQKFWVIVVWPGEKRKSGRKRKKKEKIWALTQRRWPKLQCLASLFQRTPMDISTQC